MSPAGRPFDYWIPVFTEMDRTQVRQYNLNSKQ